MNSGKPIKDEFSNLPLSRQQRYQRRKLAKGLCQGCGKEKRFKRSLFCLTCLKVRAKAERERSGYQAWNPELRKGRVPYGQK